MNAFLQRMANNMHLIKLLVLLLTLSMMSGCGKDGDAVVNYPEADTDAAKFYIAKCGACHAAPLPSIYRAARWTGIVARMQMHMNNKGTPALNEREHQLVIDYLEKHAGHD